MADVYRFPNGGYEVTVCKKQDILDCLDKNITDKEVLLDIIKQLEKDAADFIKKGRWTGIPFIGNIRVPEFTKLRNSEEQRELIAEAKDTLDHDQYIMFRKRLNIDTATKVKKERYYKYILSIAINRNNKTFRTLCKRKGETYARVFLFTCYNAMAFDRIIGVIEDE